MKIRPAGVIEEQGKVLFLRYAYPQGDVYGIPGGGVEEGESLRHALVREMEEELGIAVRVEMKSSKSLKPEVVASTPANEPSCTSSIAKVSLSSPVNSPTNVVPL